MATPPPPPPTTTTTTTTSTTATTSLSPPSSTPTQPRPPKPRPTLRILCIGDSLTAGYTSSARLHPYATRLSARLSQAFPSLAVVVDLDGVPGDGVARLARRVEPRFLARGGGTSYDWTVVLGGSNDLAPLGRAAGGAEVFEALRRVWAVPLSKGGRVLACTVPDAGVGVGGEVAERAAGGRDEVNALIRNHRQEGFHVFDLQAAIPYHTMSAPERARYWDDDHLHFTPEGYDLMGERIAASLVELIMPPGRLQPAVGSERTPRKKRTNFRDDNKKFEEENGDDNSLDQGWYVVRRKDLE